MVSVSIELSIVRSIARAIKDALPTTLVLEQGSRRDTPPTEQEWIAIDVLAVTPGTARRGVFDGRVTFQVTAFARFAESRSDQQGDAPWKLAGSIRAALEKVDVAVKAYGDGITAAFVAALEVGAASQVHLDESQLDAFPSNVHAVALTFSARVAQL